MSSHEPITLIRDCAAIEIPGGERRTLRAGMQVVVTQALGDTFTVTTQHGYMVRIAGDDADALGLAPKAGPQPADVPQSAAEIENLVWDALRAVYDPEIPVNVVDLGLIYHCTVGALPDGGFRADVTMTLTAPGCGMGEVLVADAQHKLERIPGLKEVQVQLVFDPPWSPAMMAESARLELGMY